jgi:FPC/CPF motif-containing protein YcgG
VPATNRTVRQFEARIADRRFPCIGAKSALSHQDLRYVDGGDLRDRAGDQQVLAALHGFVADAGADTGKVFVSLVALYPATPLLDEAGFEAALWSRLSALHALDHEQHDWDPTVSSDPASPRFSMSFGGRAFYVVGLHPGASRPARRFGSAALVFNLHSQFEALRSDGRYDKLREAIVDRDEAFSGSSNPMLAMHGEASEARQYSGRVVGADWRCPFHPPAAH